MSDHAHTDLRCAECGTLIRDGQDHEHTDGGAFCRPCFDRLTGELNRALEEQGRDVPWTMAFVGALGGAALGVLVWWGFTVLTGIYLGLVAVGIGFGVGRGVLMLSGHKRHRGLQVMSVAVSVLAFAYASYLVNRTRIHRAAVEEGSELVLPLVPTPDLLYQVVALSFGIMDLVFLAIVVYEAWRIPAPIRMAPPS